MTTARFMVHPSLAPFLSRERRAAPFTATCARAATLKNAIEAIGIPHTEVGAVRVNETPATLDRIVRDGDAVALLGWRELGLPQIPPTLDFVADAHLGGLARYLRMLGFDTLHDNAISDDAIRRLAADERRTVLTRDRELLKCRDILSGCYVRATRPEQQLVEVAARFALVPHALPFTRCLRCNVALVPVDKTHVLESLPAAVAHDQSAFFRCAGCGRVYWPGSHHRRMQAALARLLGSDEAGPR